MKVIVMSSSWVVVFGWVWLSLGTIDVYRHPKPNSDPLHEVMCLVVIMLLFSLVSLVAARRIRHSDSAVRFFSRINLITLRLGLATLSGFAVSRAAAAPPLALPTITFHYIF